ncbi:MAG TPA: alkaline phosphatase family protein [candidate division Zixibacteria bacterium]|nr:alkaline phosphatase family protein [candidate division Zixibacteria bacterium]
MQLNINEEFIAPDYSGSTIANIPATISSLLNAEFAGLPPLLEPLWKPMDGRVKRIVLLLLDSFGWSLLQQHRAELDWLVQRADVSGRITSVFPSTTVAALSSLWTGYAPGQHGLVGLRLFFPEYAVLGQLIKFTPSFASFPDSLIEAGTDPADFLDVPGLGQQLAKSGIQTHAFKGQNIVDSALSQMHDRGVENEYGIVTSADLFVQLREMLERTAGTPLYAYAYWPAIDTLSHVHGPSHPSVGAELRAVLNQFKDEILDSLSPAARRETAIFITGDHGQILTTPDQYIWLEEETKLNELLLMRPAGEPRTPFLYAKQGKSRDLLLFLEEHFSHALQAWDTHAALQGGLLGPGPISEKVVQRLGDVITTMRDRYILLTPKELKKISGFQGRHGGMTADEMEVPWLGFHLEQ